MPTTILTGLPRSGTSMLCALLNQLPNAVAMTEPMSPGVGLSREALIQSVHEFLEASRERALEKGGFLTKTRRGVPVDNTTGGYPCSLRLRQDDTTLADVAVGKALSKDFHLFIKHPTLFTMLAEELSKSYSLFALIRNPLAVLASWQTVAFPIHDGRLSMVERYDPSISARIARWPDRIDRQVEILSWMFDVYALLNADQVLRYEDVTADPQRQLARMHDQIVPITHLITVEPIEHRYSSVDLKPLAEGLRRIAPQVRHFYPDFDEVLDRHAG